LNHELTGVASQGPFFTLEEIRRLRLSLVHQAAGDPVQEIAYHQLADGVTAQKRIVEHARVLFFDDASPALADPLPSGRMGRLGLPFETYRLALTANLLAIVFADKLTPDVLATLDDPQKSGYIKDADDGRYWIRSGIAGFAAGAAQHFYLPERFTDAFGHVTALEYDARDLLLASTTDALGNTTRVERFDYRVLAPAEMRDINGNLAEVFFDVLGFAAASALKGKGSEGDGLAGFDDDLANPAIGDLAAFFGEADLDEPRARSWLAGASARHVYYLGETVDADGAITWGIHPACACGIARETHVGELAPGEDSALQAAFEYADGLGGVVVRKVQDEPELPGGPLRWVASGKVIFNNKGKPVRRYEPYFSPSGHRFEEPGEVGVTSVLYYDAAGRVVRGEMPDGTVSRAEFSPWFTRSFDANDCVLDSPWYADRNPPDPALPLPRDPATGQILVTEDQRAAWLAAQHANTPMLAVLDTLGREVVVTAHNRVKDAGGSNTFGGERWRDDYLVAFTKLEAQGKPLWIRDARANRVMQYITPPVPDNQADGPVSGYAPCYDIAGNLLFQHGMDGGNRWVLRNAAALPMLAWDSRGQRFRTEYDELLRPIASFVTGAEAGNPGGEIQFEQRVYGDTPANGLSDAQRTALNLRGKLFEHRDTAGVVTHMGRNPATGEDEAFDFKGNLIRSARRLVANYQGPPDWSQAPALEDESFTSAMRFDALSRPMQLVAPHSDRPGAELNVIRHGYNPAGLLERVDVWLQQANEPASLLDPQTATQHAVTSIDYDAKGQRTRIRYGNGVSTSYQHDPRTFRLTHLLTDRGSGFPDDWPQPADPPRGGIQSLSYFYDPVGNITRIRDDAQQTVFFSGQQVEPSADYEYDALYRLISATGREHAGQHAFPQVDADDSPRMNQPLPTDAAALRNYTETYDYDPAGNILRMAHQAGASGSWTRRYDYEASNNRLRATSLPGDAAGVFSASYQYDLHGNMTRMPHLPMMQWDFRDQLQASAQQVVNEGSPETTWYVYDAGGQRVRKVTQRQAGSGETPARLKERIYLGGFEVYRDYESDGAGVRLERESLHVMDDKQRIVLIETQSIDAGATPATPAPLVRYQLGNHLGSASLELDEAGRIVSYEEYHPYGSTSYQAGRSAAEVSLKRYRYTGMERDEESGLAYHSARHYAPWLGRWIGADPAMLRDGLNLYQFARSNPVTLMDPSGTDSKTSLADDMADVIEVRYRRGVADFSTDPLSKSSVQFFVILGEQSYPNCSAKTSKLELFDRGVAMFASKYHLEAKFGSAAMRGADARRRDPAPVGIWDDYYLLNGKVQVFQGTKEQHDDFLDSRINNRNLLPRITFDLIATFGGGETEAPGESSGGYGREYQHGAPLLEPSVPFGPKEAPVSAAGDGGAGAGGGAGGTGGGAGGTGGGGGGASAGGGGGGKPPYPGPTLKVLAPGEAAPAGVPTLTRQQAHLVSELRSGHDVIVRDLKIARARLANMPDIRPYTGSANYPWEAAPKGTYRGDLININDPAAPYVHPPETGGEAYAHQNNPHINIYFPNGQKAAIIVQPR
jgi:RHS repeat-associated protein